MKRMLTNLKQSFSSFVSDSETQVLGLKIIAWILIFFAPIKEVMWSVGAIIIVDLITGIWAAKKSGVKFESYKLRRSITKSAAYLTAIASGFIVQKYMLQDTIPIVHVVSGLIGATELLSIYENLSKISGVPFADKVKELLQPKKVENEPKDPPQ